MGEIIEQVARKNTDNELLIEMHGAHELFHQIHAEAKALLRNNENSTTSGEVVAMADYFMILVNSLDLEKSLEMIQSLQAALHEKRDNKQVGSDIHKEEGEEVKEKLRQAVKSMSQLHHIFLAMVESALPPKPSTLSQEMGVQSKHHDGGVDVPSFDKEKYSALTVGRALHLSRRAVELGMPMHRPLYQRLAMAVVLTSSPASSMISKPSPLGDGADFESTEPSSTEPTTLILPGQFQQIKDGLHTTPLTLELLGLFQHAGSALTISSRDKLHQLAMELLVDPFLFLLKQKRWDEAMDLIRGWRAHSGNDKKVVLLSLLGENNTLEALEIAKGCLAGGTDFAEYVQSDPHVMELSNLLEESVAEILKGRRRHAEKLNHLLWQLNLSVHSNEDDDFNEESDSDSDFEDDFDYDSESEEESGTPTPSLTPAAFSTMRNFTPSDDPIVRAQSEPQQEMRWHDKDALAFSSRMNDADTSPMPEDEQEKDRGEFTIIKGMSDKEARQCIYLRNGVDWVLPDIVSTLENWNKGNQLTFTPEFERYLGQQIMDEGEEEDDD